MKMNDLQVQLADLTVEQFCKMCGICCGFCCLAIFLVITLAGFINSLSSGYLYFKTHEYYASLRYIQKYFRQLKRCGTVLELDYANQELTAVLDLLVYQKVLPKFLYKRISDKADYLFNKLRVELSNYWNN